jgi:hypothetical protein
MPEAGQSAAAWKAQWKKALDKTAGIARYLQDGVEYVEDIRRKDAERLSRLESEGRSGH